MARAGGGSRGGGGMRSSAGRSMSRSSGGHRIGSSRAGSSFSNSARPSYSSSNRSNSRPITTFNTTKNYPPSIPRHSHHGNGLGYHGPIIRNTTVYTNNTPVYGNGNYTPSYSSEKSSGGNGGIIAVIVVVLIIAIILAISSFASNSAPASTVNREKLELGIGFNNECIVDELGWFDNVPATSRRLQSFYEKTGVQPYIVLKNYDASLTSDEAKEAYANKWYEDNINNEATFLYMYFAEQNVDEDIGYMVYVNGLQIGPVMDAEAINVFWSYLDSFWVTDMTTDDLFVETFNKTADRIMEKSTTPADVGKYAVVFFGIGITLVIILIIIETKRKHEREKAEETERILNAPLGNTSLDDLADKYADKN